MRSFSESEARDIFARAARTQRQADAATDASSPGLTLQELKEIGRAAGLDPVHIESAATGPALQPVATAQILGMPTEVFRTRRITGGVTDEAWEASVDALRQLFGGPGTSGQVGRTREWTSEKSTGVSGGTSTHVRSRALPDGGTEIVIQQRGMRANAMGLAATSGTLAAFMLMVAVIGAINGNMAGPITALVVAVLAITILGGGFVGMNWWARRCGEHFEAALDRIELLARATKPPEASGPSATGRNVEPPLTLDGVDDASANAVSGQRQRARS